jgi:hypothetical protein
MPVGNSNIYRILLARVAYVRYGGTLVRINAGNHRLISLEDAKYYLC